MATTNSVRRAVQDWILVIVTVAACFLLVSGFSLVLAGLIRPAHPWIIFLAIVLTALIVFPLRARIPGLLDYFFKPRTMHTSDRLDDFVSAIAKNVNLSEIVELFGQTIQVEFQPKNLYLFLYQSAYRQYCAYETNRRFSATDLRFSPGEGLAARLADVDGVLVIDDPNHIKGDLAADRPRLQLLECQVFVPLPGSDRLLGWLATEINNSDEPFTLEQRKFLVDLADHAAVAIGRARLVAGLEQRVQEMDVLARVAQGVNITLNFDDILELIYAQTNLVIPTRDFRISIYNQRNKQLVLAFNLENDERLQEREGKNLEEGIGLDPEVWRSRLPILSSDYAKECKIRGILPDLQSIYGWMGVPLNSAGETLGCISLGSRNPDIVYSPEQLNLLQSISDQASGAIVKARLLHESEDRAQQLATLNELSRNLTSTLELTPLLHRILTSAAEILKCQAGSLFLIDPQTDELVFEVVIGPVASDLIGKRLPPGKGVAGQAFQSSQPVIANDARRRKEWFYETDQQTGFITQDLLAVPMMIKDHTLGVIEVINKQDGQPFMLDDQEILMTFASQAAIAIENARLYTLTDQALAARVEELSVMQRIDRQLNASLDIQHALEITLEWAIRQSAAQAGLIGFNEPSGLRIMASHGYPPGVVDSFAPCVINHPQKDDPIHMPALEAALAGDLPVQVSIGSTAEGNPLLPTGLKDQARRQIGIPIRREGHAIGFLLLEKSSPEACPQEVIDFLSRLSDHAAIAISNAQLYSAVQETNLARSKFVSFVAHELKNPMASIKGYTELIAGGMAGSVNETQASFLQTIRTNVDRMNTIVSDLNDLTKIQVGAMRLEFKALAIQDIFGEVAHSLERQLHDKNQSLTIQTPAHLPAVWADPLRLTQVLTNLISNAHKYSSAGSPILIGAEDWDRDPASQSEKRMIHIWVQDQGIGIDSEDQAKIFQQYYRTEISRETAAGTGLGLNISQSLVNMQGGRIWFDSTSGVGSTFHITVQVAEYPLASA